MIKHKLLIVGAFPHKNSSIVGGIVTTCRNLMESDFPNHFELILVDSTQQSNPPPGFLIRLSRAISRTYRYLLALATKRPDAVILFTAVGASLAEKGLMARLSRFKKIPVILFPRGAELIDAVRNNYWQKLWILPAMTGATHIFCQGPTWQNFVINDLGYDEISAPIIYNWSATSELLQLGSQRSKCSYNKKLTILFLGWLEQEKGIFELLEACQKLSVRHSFVLRIAGRGHAENKARNFVAEHNLEEFVTFEGWVHGPQKMKLLECADILVLPSWAEGFPNVIIEAMAAKVAVIVSAVGNVPDIIQHRNQAMIFAPKDISSLTMLIEELLADTTLRVQLADRGYNFARDNFSTENGIQRFIEVIEDTIKIYQKSR